MSTHYEDARLRRDLGDPCESLRHPLARPTLWVVLLALASFIGWAAWAEIAVGWHEVPEEERAPRVAALRGHAPERVVVAGRVRQRDWQSDTNKGTTIEIDADTVGHDLTFGRSTFTRTVKAASAPSDSHSAPAEAQQSSTEDGPTPEAAEPSDAEAVAPF